MEQVQTSNLSSSSTIDTKIIKQCQVCKQTQKQLLRCARCKKVYYCGVQCQKKHWPSHKINCSRAKQNSNPQADKKTTDSTSNAKPQPDNPFHGLNQFQKLIHLGSGNFSQIFKTTSKKDGKTYAIKQVQKAKVQRIRKQADLFMQKHCLSKLKDCDYVIKLYRTFQDQLNLFIQMQCPENGQLWQQCKTFGLFSEPIFKYYAAHLVKALSIIHNQYEIVHRDLKPENVLLDEKNRIKIIDFGTAKDLSRPDIKGSGNGLKGKKPFQHYVGTPNYMAPQCIHNKASEKKSDIYSLSGVFYFMKVGAPPFTGGSEFIVFKKTLQSEIFLSPQLFSPELKDLLLNMNRKSMEERFDINQIMAHQYFKDIDWNNLPSYEESLQKCTQLEQFFYQKGKQIFEKYHKLALEGQMQARKKAYDTQVAPLLDSLKENLPQTFEVSKQELKWVQQRIEMMKVQAKVMFNYFDDNSTGFAQIYNKDFDSAERVINLVKYGKTDKSLTSDPNCKQNEDEEDNEETQVNMKKNKVNKETEPQSKTQN